MTSLAQNVSSACRSREKDAEPCAPFKDVQDFQNTSNLRGHDECETLCFRLQKDVMHLFTHTHTHVSTPSHQTDANASDVGTLKTGLQQRGSSVLQGFQEHTANVQNVGYQHRPNRRRGGGGSHIMHEGRYPWPPGTEGPSLPEAHLLPWR